MTTTYFSDREGISRARTNEQITDAAWGGIVALVSSLTANGAFGQDFPKMCPDGLGPVGTNEQTVALALGAEIPELSWPLDNATVPPTMAVLDLVEFCYKHVAQPSQGTWHPFFGHHHLEFGRDAGRRELQEQVNLIFARSGIAYELGTDGLIQRLGPTILRETLVSSAFNTADAELNGLLETARSKFFSPYLQVRREALEKLWDAWERLKTILMPTDKKASIAGLLDRVASETNMRVRLEAEARELTRIGNDFQIRHFEVSKVPIETSEQVDYLFHRLFAMIQLLLHAL